MVGEEDAWLIVVVMQVLWEYARALRGYGGVSEWVLGWGGGGG